MPDSSRPDWESARAQLLPGGGQEGTTFDKPPPDGPPTPRKLQVPKHLAPMVSFFNGIVADESLVLDLCFEKAMEIVERNVMAKMVGIDFFAGDGSPAGGPYTPAHYAAVAAPLSVELYKNVLKAIEGRQEEYDRIFQEMLREREKNSPGGPRIVVPGA